jgi:hypothetical protein
MRPASTRDRVLQYGAVACSLLKDIGNASNQPYLQAIASISLLIMETAQVNLPFALPSATHTISCRE